MATTMASLKAMGLGARMRSTLPTTMSTATPIRKSADDIGEELRVGRSKLAKLITSAKDVLRALEIEVEDEAAEDSVDRELVAGVPADH